MMQGAGPLAPPISMQTRTVMPGHGEWGICIRIVYTRQGSVAVLQVTGSLLFRFLSCYLTVVCFLSCSKNSTVTKSLPELLRRPVHIVRRRRCTVSAYLTSGAMGSGDAGGGWPRVERSGVSFRCELQTSWNVPWNVPEWFVNLESLGVVELDTSVVPDVLGQRALNEDAKPTWVMSGRAQNSVRVLVLDARAKPW